MKILDIGGGFTAGCSGGLSFLDAAAAVNSALDIYFPPEMEVKIIAEPGAILCRVALHACHHGDGQASARQLE